MFQYWVDHDFKVYSWKLEITRVSVETGALLHGLFLFDNYNKRLSQRYQVNMMIYKGVIVNKTSSSYRLNACSLNVSEGNYFENGKRYTKSETTIQKALEERIPNHILDV